RQHHFRRLLAGPEHGRTIPLADMRRRVLLRCAPLTHSRPAILGCDPWPRVSPMRRRDLITLLGGTKALMLCYDNRPSQISKVNLQRLPPLLFGPPIWSLGR